MKKNILLSVFTCAYTLCAHAQWEQLPYYFPRTTQSKPVVFTSPGNKLVAGLRYNPSPVSNVSLDGGTTWQQIFSDKAIATVEFGPDGTFYYVASKRYLTTSNYYLDTLFTSSDGLTWTNAGYKLAGGNGVYTEYNFTVSTGNNTVLFPNFSDISGVYLSKSTDNAVTWSATALTAGPVTCSPAADTIIVSTESPWPGGVKYSHDGGATFNTATWASGAPGGTIPVRLPNGDVYAAAIGAIYKSTDGGASFGANLLSGPIGSIQEFIYAPNGKFYIRVSGGVTGIWETTDFTTLTSITASLPDNSLLSDIDISNDYIYAIADTNLYRYSLAGGTSGISEATSTTTSLYTYPNPAGNLLYINTAPGSQMGKAILTDVSGRVVVDILPYQKIVPVHFLPNGIYYLQAAVNGQRCVQKVVIAK